MVRSGANKKELAVRLEAAVCYIVAEGEGKAKEAAAGLSFRKGHPGAVKRAAAFCALWGERLLKSYTVLDAPRTGAPQKVSVADAKAAAVLLKAPAKRRLKKAGDGWGSAKEACAACPALEEVRVRSKDCAPRTLQKAAFKHDEDLCFRPLNFRPPLSAANRAKRLATAKANLKKWRNNPAYFRCEAGWRAIGRPSGTNGHAVQGVGPDSRNGRVAGLCWGGQDRREGGLKPWERCA